MSAQEIQPCPCCGQEPGSGYPYCERIVYIESRRARALWEEFGRMEIKVYPAVTCWNCGFCAPCGKTAEEAVDNWNGFAAKLRPLVTLVAPSASAAPRSKLDGLELD